MSVSRQHQYSISMEWVGNMGTGTSGYREYKRDHVISAPGKAPIPGSSDPSFRGDRTRYNPEEMLVAALSSCHMLWYLHLCADSGIVVTSYLDQATGAMNETEDGGGHFVEVVLRPQVTVQPGADLQVCKRLHEKAHHLCFIANSVNFPVQCEPETRIEG